MRPLKPLRDEVVIATKFGWRLENGRLQLAGLDSRPGQIRRVVDASLRGLRSDVVDLFYQHRVDPRRPIEEVAGTVGELVEEGRFATSALRSLRVDDASGARGLPGHRGTVRVLGAASVLLSADDISTSTPSPVLRCSRRPLQRPAPGLRRPLTTHPATNATRRPTPGSCTEVRTSEASL